MPAEVEVKLGAPAGFRMPQLEGVMPGAVVAPPDTKNLRTTYFDTADLRLARWGFSLRHRGGEGWTLKFPSRNAGPALVREEKVFPTNGRQPPAAAVELVRALVRGDALAPVARLNTKRTRYELTDSDGQAVLEVVDDEVSIMDGRRLAGRFRELEVELKAPGHDDLLAAVVERLQAAGAGGADATPKLMRALGSRAQEPPDVVAQPAADSAPSAVVRGAIAASVARLLAHDPGARLGDDPEDVHQARVACRRLRSDLHTFAALLDPEWVAATRDELRWAGRLLGEVRDVEVLHDRLRQRSEGLPPEDRPAAERLIARLDAAHDAARKRLLEGLRSERYLRLVDTLVAAASAPPFVQGADVSRQALLGSIAAPWQKLRDEAAGLGDEPADEELHRLRIRAKRSRYAAEAGAALAPRAAGFATAVAKLQTVLGEHQDAVVAQRWLRDQARTSGGRAALVAGELIAAERSAAAGARAAWPEAWKAARKRKLRDWMKV